MALTTNLVSYWKLDEASGNAADSVGSNTLTNNGTTPYVAAKIGNGISVDGSGSKYLSITDAAQTGLEFGTGAFTISVWIKKAVTGSDMNVVNKIDNATAGNGYSLQVTNSGSKITFGVADTGSNASAQGTITDDTNWHHLVGRRTAAGLLAVFVDGVKTEPGTTFTGSVNGSPAFALGRQADRNINYFNGVIDEAGVWSRALSDAEVASLYNSGNGLAYPFANNYSSTLTDSVTPAASFSHVWTLARTLTEAVTSTATALKTIGRALLEAVTNTDSFTKGLILSSGPNSPGTMADDATVGTVAWNNPDNAKVSDGAFFPQSGYATAIFTQDAPTDSSIKIVKSDGTFGTTNKASATQWTTTDTYISYGSSSDLWGEIWSSADINDIDFGVVLSASDGAATTHYLKATNFGFSIPTGATINGILVEVERSWNDIGGNFTAYVDHIRITVTYTFSGNLYSQTLPDAIAIADSLIKTAGRSLVESVINSDTFSRVFTVVRTLSESLTTAASLFKTNGRALVEGVSAADVITAFRTVVATLEETLTTAASTIRTLGRSLSEAVTNTDALIANSTLVKTLSEAVAATDTAIRSISRALIEVLSNNDTLSSLKVLARSYTEEVTATAALIRTSGRVILEGVTASDMFSRVAAFGRTLSETLSVSDLFRRLVNGSSTIWANAAKTTVALVNQSKTNATLTNAAKTVSYWINRERS